MRTLYDARTALDRLLEGGIDNAEHERIGQLLSDYIDHIGGDYDTLAVAHRHEISERNRHFANAEQKEKELRTLRGVVGQCKGEIAEMADAALRLCDLLANRPMSADEAEAVAAMRAAMKGLRARDLIASLRDSVRKFVALSIIMRMLYKLRVSNDVREAAEKWAKKQLHL